MRVGPVLLSDPCYVILKTFLNVEKIDGCHILVQVAVFSQFSNNFKLQKIKMCLYEMKQNVCYLNLLIVHIKNLAKS